MVAVLAGVVAFGLACTGPKFEGTDIGIGPRTEPAYTPECCAQSVGGVTVYNAEVGHSDCESSGGTWVANGECSVVCCELAEFHTFMSKYSCRTGGGHEVDAATNCGE